MLWRWPVARVDQLQLKRLSDDLVYRFHREGARFRRADRALYLEWREGFGWGAWDGDELQGRPWDAPLSTQSPNAPPEGIWVSQKGVKSYTYSLIHLDDTERRADNV